MDRVVWIGKVDDIYNVENTKYAVCSSCPPQYIFSRFLETLKASREVAGGGARRECFTLFFLFLSTSQTVFHCGKRSFLTLT